MKRVKSSYLSLVFLLKTGYFWASTIHQIKITQIAPNIYRKPYSNFLTASNFNISPYNSGCIHLIITNQKSLFVKSCTFECSLSDYHNATTTILGKTMRKGNINIFSRDNQSFNQTTFGEDLSNEWCHLQTQVFFAFSWCFLRNMQ